MAEAYLLDKLKSVEQTFQELTLPSSRSRYCYQPRRTTKSS